MSEMKDSADSAADKDVSARASRANKNRVIYNESDDLMRKQVPGGRKEVEGMPTPGMDSNVPHERAMAQHSSDFISASATNNRGKMEASRAVFHAVKLASGRGTPRGVETPCTGSGCVKTAPTNKDTCGESGCGKSLNKDVSRPKE